MPAALRMRSLFAVLMLYALAGFPAFAQMERATLSGVINDPKGAVVPDVEVTATRIETGTVVTTKTNGAGIYFFTGLMPGHYHLMVRKPGFKEIAIKEFELHVQDKLEQNFSLEIGSVSETVTVTAGAATINTQDASVSTVIDRNFAENLPMNGRSFQTLIQLTPGVVLTASNGGDNGQFSVNGQRAVSNYWMLDGVSANIGVSSISPGNGTGGALGSFSVLGGTNSLVSVDAMQEFRIQTSTYAPEFGRTPGAQISISTRAGTNQFHGTAFDYLRNDSLDANDWFANANGLQKPEERQNDFGGTLGGPIIKDRTFFFFSYEGLRLRLPQVALTNVPDLNARKNAAPILQPYLNAYPLPNGSDNLAAAIAQFRSSYFNRATLDAYSLRIDHKLDSKLTFFGRYNYSPSELIQRGGGSALSVTSPSSITTQTATVGVTWALSSILANDLRFNYSRTNSSSRYSLDNFGGAVPFSSSPFPSPYTTQNANFVFGIVRLQPGQFIHLGKVTEQLQRQINLVDNLSMQRSSHNLKFGVDFRRLTPASNPFTYGQGVIFTDVASSEVGDSLVTTVLAQQGGSFIFRNLGFFAQDTWRMVPRLTLTYGLRWDIDIAPSSISGPALPAVSGFNLGNLANLALAPAGTSIFKTQFGNIAPRVGLACQLSNSQLWQTVLRGGFGVFYDLATSEVGNSILFTNYPFQATKTTSRGKFPLDSVSAAPPPITSAQLTTGALAAFDPHLDLPYTLEWNIALEQALGTHQAISASYIGAVGRRLLQTASIASPNPSLGRVQLVTNAGSSDYDALQLQFQRQLSHGLQAIASYTWSHSIDTGSAGSPVVLSNALVPSAIGGSNRGPSDFDIRNAFSAGLTYAISAPKVNAFTNAILQGWSLQNIVHAWSSPPVNAFYSLFGALSNGFLTGVRPDVVPGQSLYLYGRQYPGGKAFNPTAFVGPPTDPRTRLPVRQGNLARNALSGFGAFQWDLAVHRDFPINESLKLQFRAEMFNVLNHPNFGQPIGDLSHPQFLNPKFGTSTQMLSQSLNGNVGGSLGNGAFDPLYQTGGPRSIELALKLIF